MSKPDTRWDDVRARRAQYQALKDVSWVREPIGTLPRQALDDMDYLFSEIARLKNELSVVVSKTHKEASASAIAKQRAHFLKGMQRYAKGVQKYREQHLLDKDYIQRQKRELRRLNKLVPASERALVSQVKVEGACSLCGCLWPATNHEALAGNLAAVARSRDALAVKLKSVVGQQRRAAHNNELAELSQ